MWVVQLKVKLRYIICCCTRPRLIDTPLFSSYCTVVFELHLFSSYASEKMAEGTVLQKNPISRLQEILQQWKYPLPVYREAQGNYQQFGTEVSLTLEEEMYTFYAMGKTKKTSKANAAQEALNFVTQQKPHLLEPPPLPVGPCCSPCGASLFNSQTMTVIKLSPYLLLLSGNR